MATLQSKYTYLHVLSSKRRHFVSFFTFVVKYKDILVPPTGRLPVTGKSPPLLIFNNLVHPLL